MYSDRRAGWHRVQMVLAILSFTLGMNGVLMCVPGIAGTVLGWEDATPWVFLLPGIAGIAVGGMGWLMLRGSERLSATQHDAAIVVTAAWGMVCAFSAIPLRLLGMDFTRSIFEAVSGWTTTGLSVVDVTCAGSDFLLWRSLMQLAGGAGLAILALAALGVTPGAALPAAEGRMSLVPQIRKSAKLVLTIYAGYVVFGIAAYMAAGLSAFEAVNHALSAVSTGGFSTRVGSIGEFDSVAVEAVTCVLMIAGNLNFVTAWLVLRGNLRVAAKDPEVRLFAVVLPVAATALFALTCGSLYVGLGKAIRVSVFEALSALTTTGFSTVPYDSWSSGAFLVLVLLMLIGGGVCSTAGGLKQRRVYLLCRSIALQVKALLRPQGTVSVSFVQLGEQRVRLSPGELWSTGTFFFLYVGVLLAGTLSLCAHGYGLRESLFEYASALGTVGLSVGVTSSSAPDGVLWTETIGMFLGRLEFLVVLHALLGIAEEMRNGLHRSR